MNQRCQAAVITNGSSTQVFSSFPSMSLSPCISVSILKSSQAILAEKSMNVNLVAAEKDCFVDLNTVAIGGGGGTSKYAGSGSGYVETATLRLSVNNPVAEITVGQVDESSKVEIAGELVLEALPGLPGQTVKGYTGGAGFSGGGGSCYGCTGGLGGSGGSDGGNGTNKPAPVHPSLGERGLDLT